MWFEKIETQEIFTDSSVTQIQTPGSYFSLSTSQPKSFRLSLYVTLIFLVTFLLINKKMLALSNQLARACSFTDVAS